MNNRIKAIILVAMTIIVLVFIFLANKDSSDIKILTKKKEFNEIYYSNQPKLLFVDLRDEEDYAKSHLDNFVNIPYSEGKEGIFFKFLDDNKYDEKTIVLMCYSGNRASEMFNIMYEKGYRKVYLVNMKCDKLFSANSNNVSTGACNCLE